MQTVIRTCVGCGQKRPKTELFRLAIDGAGKALVDSRMRAPGRGAYVCGLGCGQAAMKRKSLGRAFRGKLRDLDMKSITAALERRIVAVP